MIAKLYSYRGVDHEDITDPNVLRAIDWDRLHNLATAEDEAKRSALNDRSYEQFLYDFNEFERAYRP